MKTDTTGLPRFTAKSAGKTGKSSIRRGRRLAREYVLRVLYAFELSRNPVSEIKQDLIVGKLLSEKNRAFADQLIHCAIEHSPELDEWIRSKSRNWEFHRIAILDKLILRMGLCELLYFEDIPPKVTINEAIELAKKYSTEKSGVFVNGILDAVLKELRETGRLHKTGRGLLDN